MSRVLLVCAFAAMIPVAARGEPIPISLSNHSTAVAFSQSGETATSSDALDLGRISLDGTSTGTLFFNDAKAWADYTVTFDLHLGGAAEGFQIQVLDPLGDGDDALDAGQLANVPEGFSTSNDKDGLSFAQGSGLERSATFAGGSANVTADEVTHRGDILIFSGLNGAEDARVTFGLRDGRGGRGFLLQINALFADAAPVPEPASMLLTVTGLAGLAALRRRRRGNATAQAV